MSKQCSPSHVLLVISTIILLAIIAIPAAPVSATLSNAFPSTLTDSVSAAQPAPEDSLIEALLGRYAVWLMLVICSSSLALLGAAAIVTRIRRIAGDDDDR
ncbi:hypothetical protein [Chloroflexus sp.]|uniref:hypothetical protein n=1 Tax=Chloroflexus sp. TaxID=1904827 RepID=UPI0026189AFF|nr:hypothetical protein [uncultured Chloroflexus sp.]